MTNSQPSRFPALLKAHQAAILDEWQRAQAHAVTRRADLIEQPQLQEESRAFLDLFTAAIQTAGLGVEHAAYQAVREHLRNLSRSRAAAGFTPSETATFVLSLKEPLFARIRQEFARDPQAIADETWAVTLTLDKLALYTTEVFQKSREEIVARQQQELLELSTPVVQLWQGVLALPLIGTLDSARTQIVMETLLQEIVRTGATIAIIDITGVPTVDTLVAQHLLKTVAAARLMGADCIISGIRAQIAQTIVHLGVDLEDVITKASLADAFSVALKMRGLTVVKARAAAVEA